MSLTDPILDTLKLGRQVGMVVQQYNLLSHKTVLENIMMAPVLVLRENELDIRKRAHKLITKVQLGGKEDSYPGELSGGQ